MLEFLFLRAEAPNKKWAAGPPLKPPRSHRTGAMGLFLLLAVNIVQFRPSARAARIPPPEPNPFAGIGKIAPAGPKPPFVHNASAASRRAALARRPRPTPPPRTRLARPAAPRSTKRNRHRRWQAAVPPPAAARAPAGRAFHARRCAASCGVPWARDRERG